MFERGDLFIHEVNAGHCVRVFCGETRWRVLRELKGNRQIKHPTIRMTKEQHVLFLQLYPTVTDIQDLLDAFPSFSQKQLTLYATRCKPRIRLTKVARSSCHFQDAWAGEMLPKGPAGKAWHRVMLRLYTRVCCRCRVRYIKSYMVYVEKRWYCGVCAEKKGKLDTMIKNTVHEEHGTMG